MPTKPMRLPPLRVLRVKDPNKTEAHPCLAVMQSVLSCWASTSYSTSQCAGVELALRTCIDGPPPPRKPSNNINYHLARFKKYFEGPTKRNGKKKK